MVFGEDSPEADEPPVQSRPSDDLLNSTERLLNALTSGVARDAVSYWLEHEPMPGYQSKCRATGMFHIPGSSDWHSLDTNFNSCCVMTRRVDLGDGVLVVAEEIDVSDRDFIETDVYGTINIVRKPAKRAVAKYLRKLKRFLVKHPACDVTIALC
jgi:hypothetical protein